MMKWILILNLIFSFSSMACNIDGTGGFAPENNLNIPVDAKINNGMTEEIFDNILDRIEAVYKPIIIEKTGLKFVLKRYWSKGIVNASAGRILRGTTAAVNMFGGLARHELMTKDGFAMVVCHEIGHHVGGAPKYKKRSGRDSWAANEGQSDYFAGLKCFRRVYASDDNIAIIKNLTVPKVVSERCNKTYQNEEEAALCIRSIIAAKATTDLLGTLMNTGITSFNTRDNSTVEKTFHGHPHAQCRLDTYIASASCDKDVNEDVDSKDPNKGTCNRKDGDLEGLRSLCWYKPGN